MTPPTMTADEAVVRSSWPRVTPLDSVRYLQRAFEAAPTGRSEHAGHVLTPCWGVPGDRSARKDARATGYRSGVVPIGKSDGRHAE